MYLLRTSDLLCICSFMNSLNRTEAPTSLEVKTLNLLYLHDDQMFPTYFLPIVVLIVIPHSLGPRLQRRSKSSGHTTVTATWSAGTTIRTALISNCAVARSGCRRSWFPARWSLGRRSRRTWLGFRAIDPVCLRFRRCRRRSRTCCDWWRRRRSGPDFFEVCLWCPPCCRTFLCKPPT